MLGHWFAFPGESIIFYTNKHGKILFVTRPSIRVRFSIIIAFVPLAIAGGVDLFAIRWAPTFATGNLLIGIEGKGFDGIWATTCCSFGAICVRDY